jgi:hypothetical protein
MASLLIDMHRTTANHKGWNKAAPLLGLDSPTIAKGADG